MFIKVFDPFQGCLVFCPAFWGGPHDPRGWQVGASVPRSEVDFPLNDQERRQHKTVARYAINRGRPFPTASLMLLASPASIGARNNHAATNKAHHKARLVEVVEVAIEDTVLGAHVCHQSKPRVYRVWIFAEGSLEVVSAISLNPSIRGGNPRESRSSIYFMSVSSSAGVRICLPFRVSRL